VSAVHAAANSFRLLRVRSGPYGVGVRLNDVPTTGDGLMSKQHRNQAAIQQQQSVRRAGQ
jgi:hypothetical protein